MYDRLEEVETRYVELERLLGDPAVLSDQQEYQKIAKQRADLEEVVTRFRELRDIERQIAEAREMMDSDPEMREIAREEYDRLQEQLPEAQSQLKLLLLPKDPNDDKNVIVEVRSGTGGEEASLFAQELYRMYLRYAERRNWKVEILSEQETGLGGIKEVVFSIQGKGAYSRLKFESGVHRVQRVPPPNPAGVSTPRPPPLRFCPRWRMWKFTSLPRISRSIPTAPAAPAVSTSTKPVPPSASPTSRPVSSSRARTNEASSRTRTRRCAC